jgi:hypothetical protein
LLKCSVQAIPIRKQPSFHVKIHNKMQHENIKKYINLAIDISIWPP